MGLSLADRHLLLEAPSPAFPSESRQPVSANVQAREGRERGKAGAGVLMGIRVRHWPQAPQVPHPSPSLEESSPYLLTLNSCIFVSNT